MEEIFKICTELGRPAADPYKAIYPVAAGVEFKRVPAVATDTAPVALGLIPLLVYSRSGLTFDLLRFPSGKTDGITAAAAILKENLLDAAREIGLQEAIGSAAEQAGCEKEDLCAYLMALGIGAIKP